MTCCAATIWHFVSNSEEEVTFEGLKTARSFLGHLLMRLRWRWKSTQAFIKAQPCFPFKCQENAGQGEYWFVSLCWHGPTGYMWNNMSNNGPLKAVYVPNITYFSLKGVSLSVIMPFTLKSTFPPVSSIDFHLPQWKIIVIMTANKS